MSIGYVFSAVVGHLPVLAVLIAGLVLIGTRRARIGPRSAMFAQFGAGLLLVAEVLQLGWSLAFPSLISALDYDSTRYQTISIAVSVLLSLLFAVGIGMLIAAVVARAPGAGGPGFAGPGFGGSGFGGPGVAGPGFGGPGVAGPGVAGPGTGGPGVAGPGYGGPGFSGPGAGGPGFSGPGAGGPGFSGSSPDEPGGGGPGYGGSGGGGPAFGPGPGFEPAPGQPTQRF